MSSNSVSASIFKLFVLLVAQADFRGEPASPSLPRFINVADEVGLGGFINKQGSPRKDYILESIGGGCAFLDYNRDGWLDILLIRGSSLDSFARGGDPVAALYRNNRDGTFTDVSKEAGLLEHRGWGMGVTVADYDGDGHEDFYVTGYGRSFLFRNRGDGRFEERSAGQSIQGLGLWSAGAVFFDYDRDGDLDLYVSRYVRFDYKNPTPRGPLCKFKGMSVFCGPQGFESEAHSLYRNDGRQGFKEVSQRAGILEAGGAAHGLGVISFDHDNDGRPDIYVGNDSTPNLLWRNSGDGSFRNLAVDVGTAFSSDGMEQASMGVEAGDLFNRGLLDLYVTNFSGEANELYKNNGSGKGFEDITWKSGVGAPALPLLGWGTHMIDIDGDGWLDIVAVNGHVYPEADAPGTGTSYKQKLLVFRNLQDGKFASIGDGLGPAFAARYAARGSAVGDFDNDGLPDLLINNIDGPPSLLRQTASRQTAERGRNWLAVELEGPSQAGARVHVRKGELTQMREINTQSGYLSSSAKIAYFGFPESGPIDEVTVSWPNGKRQRLENVKGRAKITISEPRP